MKKITLIASLVLSLLFFQGCNSNEVEKLKSENIELQNENTTLQNTNEELEYKIVEVEDKLSNIESYVSNAQSHAQSTSHYLEDTTNYMDDFTCRDGLYDIEGAVSAARSTLHDLDSSLDEINSEL